VMTVNNVRTGKICTAGRINADVLTRSIRP